MIIPRWCHDTGTFGFVLWQLRQPKLRPVEALSGFGGEHRSRKEGRNFDCSDSWRILPASLTRVCSRSSHTICRGAAKPTQPHSLQRSHPHLINSIFASKLHAQDPLHWVICIRLICWHGAHLQAVAIMMKILLPDPEKLPSSLSCLWSRNLRVLTYLSW